MLAAAGILSFAWAVNGLLSRDPGWTEIEANHSEEPTCAGDFVFYYNVGADGSSPAEQFKTLAAIYGDAAIRAEKLFSATVADDEIHGLEMLNANVNKPVVLEKEVYDALALLQKNKSRELFLAPVYEQYSTLFFCGNDDEAAILDPRINEEQREIISDIIAYTSDPQQIDIVLGEDCHATLLVSDQYLAYAKENGIETFIDLFWMKNAFAADYMAERLAAAGFTEGYISCGDGFTRNLGGSVSLNSSVFDRVEKTVYPAATLQFGAVKSVVVFHDFPAGRTNDALYYQYADGRMVTPYIAVSDGLCRAAVSNLTVSSDSMGCAATMLAAKQAYFSEKFQAKQLQKQLGDPYSFAFTKDSTVFFSSSGISVEKLLNDGNIAYTAKMIGKQPENQ